MSRFTAAVRDYLATCEANRGLVSKKYHPTEDGALKVIFHRGRDEAAQIREAFRAERPAGRRAGKQVR